MDFIEIRFWADFSDATLGGACFALVPAGISLDSDDVPDALGLFLFACIRGCGYGWVELEDAS